MILWHGPLPMTCQVAQYESWKGMLMVCNRILRNLAAILIVAFPISAYAVPTTQPEAPPWTVAPAKISVNRSIDFEPSDNEFGDMFSKENLNVKLRVGGPDFRQIVAYGKINFDEVKDDLGDDLNPSDAKKENAGGIKIIVMDVGEDMYKIHEFAKNDRGFTIDFDLMTPPRSAKELVRVKGNMTLRDRGAEQNTLIANLPSLNGKDIADPTLPKGRRDCARRSVVCRKFSA